MRKVVFLVAVVLALLVFGGCRSLSAMPTVPTVSAPPSEDLRQARQQILDLMGPDTFFNLLITGGILKSEPLTVLKWDKSAVAVCVESSATTAQKDIVRDEVGVVNGVVSYSLLAFEEGMRSGCEIDVRFLSHSEWSSEMFDADSDGLADYQTDAEGRLSESLVDIRLGESDGEYPTEYVRSVVLHELLHSVGFDGHNCHIPNSILYQCKTEADSVEYDESTPYRPLIDEDIKMIRLLYNPLIRHGMTAEEFMGVYNDVTGESVTIPQWVHTESDRAD